MTKHPRARHHVGAGTPYSQLQLPTPTLTPESTNISSSHSPLRLTMPEQEAQLSTGTEPRASSSRAEIRSLYHVLQPLGLERYVYKLLEAGFRTWGELRAITEGDMEKLGLKLGHRRKLQRAIASEIGIPHDEPLHDWPLLASTEHDDRDDRDRDLGPNQQEQEGRGGEEGNQMGLWIYSAEGRLVEVRPGSGE